MNTGKYEHLMDICNDRSLNSGKSTVLNKKRRREDESYEYQRSVKIKTVTSPNCKTSTRVTIAEFHSPSN